MCWAGKLFAVQQWFTRHRYHEPERFNWRHWPIGIAIEKGFHSLIEVLLQNGVPADARALQRACEYRNRDIVELMFQHGATVDSVEFDYIVSIGDGEIIRRFIDLGADLITRYPIASGLIRQTRLFLGIYKSNIDKHPELQFQAAMALRHFCDEGSLRGVSLMMWLGANPRTKVPHDADDEDEEYWDTAMQAAAWKGQMDIIKRLKPDPALDDVNQLLNQSLHCRSMELVRYWVALGADRNHTDAEGHTMHRQIMTSLAWSLESRGHWYFRDDSAAVKQFAKEWFSEDGVKWSLIKSDISALRKVLSRLSDMDAYEFVKLLLAKQAVAADELGEVLDCPKLKEHLKERHAAVAGLIPKLQKWVKAAERKQQLERQRVAASRRHDRQPTPPRRSYPESPVTWNDPRYVRRLSDE